MSTTIFTSEVQISNGNARDGQLFDPVAPPEQSFSMVDDTNFSKLLPSDILLATFGLSRFHLPDALQEVPFPLDPPNLIKVY